jgi:hypothetical protein
MDGGTRVERGHWDIGISNGCTSIVEPAARRARSCLYRLGSFPWLLTYSVSPYPESNCTSMTTITQNPGAHRALSGLFHCPLASHLL